MFKNSRFLSNSRDPAGLLVIMVDIDRRISNALSSVNNALKRLMNEYIKNYDRLQINVLAFFSFSFIL